MENEKNIGLLCIECRIRSAWLVRNAEQTLGDPRGSRNGEWRMGSVECRMGT